MATQLASHCSLCRLLVHFPDRIYKAEKQNSDPKASCVLVVSVVGG
jgi:hypothetical protein